MVLGVQIKTINDRFIVIYFVNTKYIRNPEAYV